MMTSGCCRVDHRIVSVVQPARGEDAGKFHELPDSGHADDCPARDHKCPLCGEVHRDGYPGTVKVDAPLTTIDLKSDFVEVTTSIRRRGVDFDCEGCGKREGSFLEDGWYRCNACGYPSK